MDTEVTQRASRRLIRRLGRIRDLTADRKDKQAAKVVERTVEEFPYCVPLLVLAAELLQISDAFQGTLEDIERLLTVARELDDDNLDSLLELAYFTYAVQDDPRRALILFEELQTKAHRFFQRALIGRARCLLDLDQMSEAKRLLQSERRALAGDPGAAEITSELRKSKRTSPVRVRTAAARSRRLARSRSRWRAPASVRSRGARPK